MVVRYKKTYSVTENEDGADYADIIRNIGIKRVVDILAKLERVSKDDKELIACFKFLINVRYNLAS